MGGGDLNLKKSWHPHTLKNQEKVWKAEQAKQSEESKLKDLRREIEDERNREELTRIGVNSGVLTRGDNDKKLEWMYKGSTELINREEYLLGRKIDKSFETLQAEEKEANTQNLIGIKQQLNHVEHECIPFSIRSYKNAQSTEQVDMQRKVMEDPLMLIKQKEIESRRKLLENPVKLKELHRMLKTDQMLKMSKKSKKSKKSTKKLKKKHKKRKSKKRDSDNDTDTDSESDQDLDKQLEKQYKKLKENNGDIVGLSLSKLLNAKYDTLSKELDKAARTTNKSNSNSDSNTNDDNSDDDANTKKTKQNTYKMDGRARSNSMKQYRVQRSRSPYRHHESRASPSAKYTNRKYSRSLSPKDRRNGKRYEHRQESIRNKRSERIRSRSPREQRRRSRNRSTSPHRRKQTSRSRRSRSNSVQRRNIRRSLSRTRSPRPKPTIPHRTTRLPSPEASAKTAKQSIKLSDDEKAAKLREMMENANWREVDRSKAVKKHREAYANEEEVYKTRDFDKNFINKEVKKAIDNHSSVGTRIRANLNNIQRTTAAMDSNFTRK